MTEFTLAERTYRVAFMLPKVQLKIMRRLLRLLKALDSDAMTAVTRSARAGDGKPSWDAILEFAAPLLGSVGGAMADMPDEDQDFITQACLKAVERRTDDGRWLPITAGEQLKFEDISAAQIMVMVQKVLSEKLGDFFSELGALFPKAADLP